MLFEKGTELKDVYAILQDFVEPRVIRAWHESWKATHGTYSDFYIQGQRLPLPPIDWDAVTLETLQQVNERGLADPGAARISPQEPEESGIR